MTPLQLGILLSCYVGNRESFDNSNRTTEVYRHQFDALVADGMIIGSFNPAVISEKGKFWVQHVLNVPYPTQKWEIPNEQ